MALVANYSLHKTVSVRKCGNYSLNYKFSILLNSIIIIINTVMPIVIVTSVEPATSSTTSSSIKPSIPGIVGIKSFAFHKTVTS
jgi:hypothetical protein